MAQRKKQQPQTHATPRGLRAKLTAAVAAAEPQSDPRLVFVADDAVRDARERASRQQWCAARDELVCQLERGERVVFQRWGTAYGKSVRALLHAHWIERAALCELVGDELLAIDIFHDIS